MKPGELIPKTWAEEMALELLHHLEQSCHRITVAGSLRRGLDNVHDIELVAIPRDAWFNAGGEPDLESCLLALKEEGLLKQDPALKRSGLRYQHFLYREMPVDLFLVLPPAQWGVILAIRTGPVDHSRYLVTRARQIGLRVRDGALRPANDLESIIPTPEEEDFYQALGLAWVPPERR